MKVLFNLLGSIGLIFLRGFTIKTLWAWFVVTTFPVMPHLSFVAALGLGLMVQVLMPLSSTKASEWDEVLVQSSNERLKMSTVNIFIHTMFFGIMLGMGYIVHLFM